MESSGSSASSRCAATGVVMTALLVLLTAAAGARTHASVQPATILVMGDSISAAYGIQRDEGWVELLAGMLTRQGYSHRVVNASISGETTSGGLARLPQALTTHDPEIVIIELGGNDGLRGYPTADIHCNLQAMVELVIEQGRRPLLVGMQIPPNYGPRYTRAFHAVFEEIATANDTPLVPFLLEDVALAPGLMQDDGIHPTAEAQPLLLRTLWPHLEPLLASERGD